MHNAAVFIHYVPDMTYNVFGGMLNPILLFNMHNEFWPGSGYRHSE